MKLSEDCTIRVIDMPHESGGMVVLSPDGHYNVYINARYGHLMQRRKFKHELRHILNDDFHSPDDIRTIEARADGRPLALRCIPKLIRARDLLPRPSIPAPAPGADPAASPAPPVVSITPHQAAVLLRCISDLDAWFSRTDFTE